MTNPDHSAKPEPDESGSGTNEVQEVNDIEVQSTATEVTDADTAVDESELGTTESETATESEVDESGATPAGSKWSRLRDRLLTGRALVTGAGIVLLIAALVVAGVLGWKLHQKQAVDQAGQQALAAAQQYAVILTSVDASKLDQNFAAVLDGATGQFKDMYSQSSGQLKQLLIDNKAKAEGKVIAAGIKSATPDKVEVLLFLDQSVTNSVNPKPRLDRNRIIMTMEHINGRWLASDVELP